MRILNLDHSRFCSWHSSGTLLLTAGCMDEWLRVVSPPKPVMRIGSKLAGWNPSCCQLPSLCPCGQSPSIALLTGFLSALMSKDHGCVDAAAASRVRVSRHLGLEDGRPKRFGAGPASTTVSWATARGVHSRQLLVKTFACGSNFPSTLLMRSCAAAFLLQLSLYCAGANAAQFESSVAMRFPWEAPKAQVEPGVGTCATCIGVVDETLGSCNAMENCVSSFDDRPVFFAAPWEFEGELVAAVRRLKAELRSSGATIKEEDGRYVHAIFSGEDGVVDDVEFLFSDPLSDATVCIRAASRAIDYDDHGRNRKRLEELRMALRWDEVPILRNRVRKLFFIESPWDTFGPEPPPTFNHKNALDFAPE